MPETLTFTAYAAHRGVTQPYISQLVAKGTLYRELDGRIDPIKADAILDAVADPEKQYTKDRHAATRAAKAWQEPERSPPAASPTAPFHNAKTVDATFVAKLRKLEYDRQVGTLIEADAYGRGMEEAATAVRKEVENMVHRLASTVAAESDVRRCQTLMEAEVDRAFTTLAETCAALAAKQRGATRQ